jgi:hypothetical protein
MKRSGHVHQVWSKPTLDSIEAPAPITPELSMPELFGSVARACLQPLQSYYSRLQVAK